MTSSLGQSYNNVFNSYNASLKDSMKIQSGELAKSQVERPSNYRKIKSDTNYLELNPMMFKPGTYKILTNKTEQEPIIRRNTTHSLASSRPNVKAAYDEPEIFENEVPRYSFVGAERPTETKPEPKPEPVKKPVILKAVEKPPEPKPKPAYNSVYHVHYVPAYTTVVYKMPCGCECYGHRAQEVRTCPCSYTMMNQDESTYYETSNYAFRRPVKRSYQSNVISTGAVNHSFLESSIKGNTLRSTRRRRKRVYV